jgi:hypothetical protein
VSRLRPFRKRFRVTPPGGGTRPTFANCIFFCPLNFGTADHVDIFVGHESHTMGSRGERIDPRKGLRNVGGGHSAVSVR